MYYSVSDWQGHLLSCPGQLKTNMLSLGNLKVVSSAAGRDRVLGNANRATELFFPCAGNATKCLQSISRKTNFIWENNFISEKTNFIWENKSHLSLWEFAVFHVITCLLFTFSLKSVSKVESWSFDSERWKFLSGVDQTYSLWN